MPILKTIKESKNIMQPEISFKQVSTDFTTFKDTPCLRDFKEMDKPLGADDFAAMEGQLRQCVEEDRRYSRINDVKCDAIHTAKTYEEFADRVAAAHLRPLEKADYKKKCSGGWNQFAVKDKSDEE